MPAQSAASDEARQIRAYTLELELPPRDGKPAQLQQLTLPLNPQSFSMTEPSRSKVEQTLGGVYVDERGSGLPIIQLEGHTGYAEKTIVDGLPPMDGYQGFTALVGLLRNYHAAAQTNATTKESERKPVILKLHVWEEHEHWQVIPNGAEALRRSRSAQQPLLFSYALSLVGVANLKQGPSALASRLATNSDPLGWGKAITLGLANIGKAVGDWAKSVKLPGGVSLFDVVAGLMKTAQDALILLKQTGKSAVAAQKALLAPLAAAQRSCRQVMATIADSMDQIRGAAVGVGSGVGSILGNARRLANEVRHLCCVFTNMHSYWSRFTTGVHNTLLDDWDAAGRAEMRC